MHTALSPAKIIASLELRELRSQFKPKALMEGIHAMCMGEKIR